MARQQAVAEINAFVKGLVTEASPLTFPENASIDELNLIPQTDGSRKRRPGMDLESGALSLESNQIPSSQVTFSSFSWKGPGGFAEKEIAVVQTGNRLCFLDSTKLPLSSALLYFYDLQAPADAKVSMASVDGILIVVSGDDEVLTYDYDGTSVIPGSGRLLIRDLFGVEDIVNGVNLLEGNNITIRPTVATNNHIYNLRNQTFALPRKWQSGSPNASEDPIEMMRAIQGIFQSNADNLVVFLYADANNDNDRNTKRYFVADNFQNPLGTNRAPVGYFIIDALNRGASRLSSIQALYAANPLLKYPVTSLPADRTPGGASVVSTFAGRVFYAGFSSQVVDGDSQSPRMTSYVLFSRLVQSSSDVFKCYQEGDPTSSETPDLVDTDGGFLRLDGAYNINRLVNVGDSLMAVAENGVWKITGGSGYGFKATDYVVTKVTEHGTVAPSSVVLVDNTLMYWSDDGIYHVNQNQYGDWVASNLTTSSIQKYYDAIPSTVKSKCFGAYDSYTRKVRWLYNNYYQAPDVPTELVLDVGLGAFYPAKINKTSNEYPLIVSSVRVPPYKISTGSVEVITNSGDDIFSSGGDRVSVREVVSDSSLSELYYLTIIGEADGKLRFSFSYYRDNRFLDWYSVNNQGVDAAAYLVTGWTGMGDFQRVKQMQYLTVYSVKTETGFDANFNPTNESSILAQSQWNWTNSGESGKWGPTFQAYRHKRLWIPPSVISGFDDGEYVVTTKNKLRGRGRVLSLKFSTEPGKDFHLLGWSYIGGINGTV